MQSNTMQCFDVVHQGVLCCMGFYCIVSSYIALSYITIVFYCIEFYRVVSSFVLKLAFLFYSAALNCLWMRCSGLSSSSITLKLSIFLVLELLFKEKEIFIAYTYMFEPLPLSIMRLLFLPVISLLSPSFLLHRIQLPSSSYSFFSSFSSYFSFSSSSSSFAFFLLSSSFPFRSSILSSSSVFHSSFSHPRLAFPHNSTRNGMQEAETGQGGGDVGVNNHRTRTSTPYRGLSKNRPA